MHTYVCAYIHTWIYVQIQMHLYLFIDISISKPIWIYIYAYIHLYLNIISTGFCINTWAHTGHLPVQSNSRASFYPFVLFYIYNFHMHSDKTSSNYPQYIYIIAQSLNTQKVVPEFLTMSLWKIKLVTVEFNILRGLFS